jgi:hypothetical protein
MARHSIGLYMQLEDMYSMLFDSNIYRISLKSRFSIVEVERDFI